MRKTIAAFLGALSLCALASLASAQQPVTFNVGDPVDYYSFGKWSPCFVSAPAKYGSYGLQCGELSITAKADPKELRAHVAGTKDLRVDAAFNGTATVEASPTTRSLGAQFGTREPRTCDPHKSVATNDDARERFICDNEHEFGGSLYLVSDVSLLASTPRAFNAAEDSAKTAIDATAPVFDIRVTYNNYQCSKIPKSYDDFPGTRNCDEFKMANAAGSCFKNTNGEWHCMMYDFHRSALATATNVVAPLGDK